MTFALPGPGSEVLTFSAAAREVLRHLQQVVGLETWVVTRLESGRAVAVVVEDSAHVVEEGVSTPWLETLCARHVEDAAPAVAPDLAAVPSYAATAQALGLPYGSFVTVPLRGPSGELLGTLCGAGAAPCTEELHDVLPLLTVLAALLAQVLDRDVRHAHDVLRTERVERSESAVDGLTGLSSRRAWDRALSALSPLGAGASVVVLDVDGLLGVNRSHGHDAGDALLRAVATALRAVAGPDDVLARIGGDELGAVLVGTPARAADVVARLRSALARQGTSASIGLALGGPDGLFCTWRDADAAGREDKLASGGVGRNSPPPVEAEDGGVVQELLELARRQLRASISFVGAWQDGVRTMRGVSSAVPLPIGPGHREALETTYCKKIVDGLLPNVIPDTSLEPEAMALEVTQAVGIGSYVGVPVVLQDGRLYGTLCCLSPNPDPTLDERDGELLVAIAASMARVLDAEEQQRGAQRELLARLDVVLAGGATDIVYQPVVSLDDGRVVGSEALARFSAPPLRPPDHWFADAAQVGLTVELELATARQALALGADLPGWLAVNFSPTTICSPGFAVLMATCDPARLVVEVSEHEEVDDYVPVLAALAPLRSRGLRVAVDDAGAGFASLRHVVKLAPDVIKLDISLVRGIDADRTRQALAAALTTFAHETSAVVVAEGVETDAERAALRLLGVGLCQGWYVGRGVPAQEFQSRWGRPAVPTSRTAADDHAVPARTARSSVVRPG